MESCYTRSSSAPDGLRLPRLEDCCKHHVGKLQVLQSKCLRLVTGAPWYLNNRQINEYLGLSLLADHLRALTESFDSKLADAGNPFVRQRDRYSCRGLAPSLEVQNNGLDNPQAACSANYPITDQAIHLGIRYKLTLNSPETLGLAPSPEVQTDGDGFQQTSQNNASRWPT